MYIPREGASIDFAAGGVTSPQVRSLTLPQVPPVVPARHLRRPFADDVIGTSDNPPAGVFVDTSVRAVTNPAGGVVRNASSIAVELEKHDTA